MTTRGTHAPDLFGDPRAGMLPTGASIFPGLALMHGVALIDELQRVVDAAPFRHMVTPGGFTMSVAMTNCGDLGWITDRRGYRYSPSDPLSQASWPAMPLVFRDLARDAATRAGYAGFDPDACLINRYEPGARMTLHQDKNERDMSAPIVSVSLGLSATFQVGGLERTDPVQKLALTHGDVLVWGGPSRLVFHGILPLKDGVHAKLGRARINLTFRTAG